LRIVENGMSAPTALAGLLPDDIPSRRRFPLSLGLHHAASSRPFAKFFQKKNYFKISAKTVFKSAGDLVRSLPPPEMFA
jgi:hypothetical protein